MRRIKKALWLVLALAFLLEAWAWAQLQPLLLVESHITTPIKVQLPTKIN